MTYPTPNAETTLQPAPPASFIADAMKASLSELREELVSGLTAVIKECFPSAHETPDRPEPLLTVDDVAKYLNVSRRTVENIISEGELVPLRIRGSRRFTRAALDAYVRTTAKKHRKRRAT